MEYDFVIELEKIKEQTKALAKTTQDFADAIKAVAESIEVYEDKYLNKVKVKADEESRE